MSEHKIQSTDAADSVTKKKGNRNGTEDEETFDNFDSSPKVPRSKRLVVDLDPVPKFLKNLVEGWSPQGMIVSFKLETDPNILVHKARYSLDRYQHHLVIGNLLYVTNLFPFCSHLPCPLVASSFVVWSLCFLRGITELMATMKVHSQMGGSVRCARQTRPLDSRASSTCRPKAGCFRRGALHYQVYMWLC